MLQDAETWVAIGFLIFIGVLVYFGAPQMITRALDDRAKRVQDELDEARRLKDHLLALPIHQDLDAAHIAYEAEQVRLVAGART